MMLNVTTGFLLAGLAGLITAVLIFFLCKKVFKWKSITSGFWALFLAMFPFTAVVMINGRVCIVNQNKQVTTYMVLGTSDYTMSNGEVIPINPPFQKCLVVNDSQEDLVLEEVVYGDMDAETTDELIPSMETLVFDGTGIEYAFEQRPPLIISSKKSGVITRYWIRTLDEYIVDYPLDDEMEEGDEVNADTSSEETVEE